MSNKNPQPEDLLPLTPAVYYILFALVDGERHGYSIMQEVGEITNQTVQMGPGTLYGSIKRMLAANLIEETEEHPAPAIDDKRRRFYRLTPFGHRVLILEVERLANLVQQAKARQLLPNSA